MFFDSKIYTRNASTLVLIEHRNAKIIPASLSAISAATKLGNPITALVGGSGADVIAAVVAKTVGVSKVLVTKDSAYDGNLAEVWSRLIVKVVGDEDVNGIVAAHTSVGKNIIPRVSAVLDVACVPDVVGIEGDVFVRPVYAGNAIARVKATDKLKIFTVRPTSFAPAGTSNSSSEIVEAPKVDTSSLTQWIGEELTKSDRPELGSAKVVVGGGRGLKSAENFKILYDLADKLGGTVGASRAAVDAGFVPNDLQIGQTGKIIAPQLYIAVGISGAIQHLAGMKDSKVIVAINKDSDAPIFQVADYGLVADLFEAVPELTSKIPKIN
ncbi:hypothetical protein HK096_004744 [Nowakowskiella sp. JEL0078]|nr:hypothetical protein HK096_004744 [Nowakowskiella sp. JEL0078]